VKHFLPIIFLMPQECLQTAAIEDSFLEVEELLKIALSLATVFECKVFLDKAADLYPELHQLGLPVKLFRASSNLPSFQD